MFFQVLVRWIRGQTQSGLCVSVLLSDCFNLKHHEDAESTED